MGRGDRGHPRHQVRERVEVDRCAAPGPVEQGCAAQGGEQGPRAVARDRGERDRGVAEHLGEDPAEPDHEHRSEAGVAEAAHDQLDAGVEVGHHLDRDGRRREARDQVEVGALRRGGVRQSEDDAARVGLVQAARRP